MEPTLALIGVAKLVFGLIVGVVGITLAARLVKRFSGFDSIDAQLRNGNVAVGIALAGAIVAMGILVRHAVTGTFGALDLLSSRADHIVDMGWIIVYALVHVTAALAVGAAVLVLGIRSFVRLTPGVDEVAEIRQGNVAGALVLAAMLVVLALLAQQGVETMLDALLPLPTLGRDMVAPA